MQIEKHTEGKWKVVKVTGRFDAQNSSKVEIELKNELDQGHKFLAVDLVNIQYMSSAGLRVLLAVLKSIKNQSGTMVLLNPQQNVMEVLELSGFSKIFMIAESLEGLL